MPVPTYSIRCLRKTLVASGVYELEFTKPAGLTFAAGQFVLIQTPLVNDPTNLQVRAYSVASLPQDDTLLLLIKIVPGGRMGRFLAEQLEVGTELAMQGPFGVFAIDRDPAAHLVFVATGTGMAPMRPFLRALLSAQDPRSIDVVFGVREAADLFWVEWLRSIENERLRVHVTLTRPTPEWSGLTGRVHTVLPKIIRDWGPVAIHACGNPAMITELKTLALQTWHVPKTRWHAEAYI